MKDYVYTEKELIEDEDGNVCGFVACPSLLNIEGFSDAVPFRQNIVSNRKGCIFPNKLIKFEKIKISEENIEYLKYIDILLNISKNTYKDKEKWLNVLKNKYNLKDFKIKEYRSLVLKEDYYGFKEFN